MLRNSTQSGDKKQDTTDSITAAVTGAATSATSSVADTNAYAEMPRAVLSVGCRLEFVMDIDPVTFKPRYALIPTPYYQNFFTALNEKVRLTNDDSEHRKKFFESFAADNGKSILASLNTLLHQKPLSGHYPPYSGVITGVLVEEYVHKDYHQFGEGQFGAGKYCNLKCFLSFIDLIIRNKLSENEGQLNVQLAYQKQTYGIELDAAERFKLCILLRNFPIVKMQSDLQFYLDSKNAKKQEKPLGASLALFSGLTPWASITSPTIGASSSSAAAHATPDNLVQERLTVAARLRADQYTSAGEQKQDFKQLFALRPYYKPDETYCHRVTM